ncbi:hypothetical protein U0X36_10920 [Bacillus thuringiensis]|uniref:hypothetical protein n=1 Tax=Bacillus thuringiensis TaxID=1428 RepID=UPI000E4F1CE7|nr:hypothetical protein [Bacillus thuringiensis]MDZ3953405.1 hypothetical protein [Bacillus thuringiensis]RGP43022.1 hypothetical protein BTW32_30260 [Bacillus thuringiensis]
MKKFIITFMMGNLIFTCMEGLMASADLNVLKGKNSEPLKFQKSHYLHMVSNGANNSILGLKILETDSYLEKYYINWQIK